MVRSVLAKARRAMAVTDPGRLRFFLRKFRHPIRPTDLVVDVGSGGDPHPRADVLVDNDIVMNAHRPYAFRRAAPTVVADIMALPFRAGCFDFSICSHVLEHLDDPVGAARELSRVSRAGYVETPTDIHEKLFPMTWHKWMVREDGRRIHFDAKPSAMLDERLSDWAIPLLGRSRSFRRAFWSRSDDFFLQHYWTGTLDVVAHGEPAEWFAPEERESAIQRPDAEVSSDAKRRVYDLLSAARYGRQRRPSS